MLKNKLILALFASVVAGSSHSQILKLDAVIDSIKSSHPVVKMYDNESHVIRGEGKKECHTQ